MSHTVVSVVIPALNAAGTLPAQLEALARQDVDVPWEVVVVDNGSTDGTLEVCRSYQGRVPGLRTISCPRPGTSAARNAGAAASSSELLLFCDADDEVAPGWVGAMVAALRTSDAVGGAIENDKLTTVQMPYMPRHPDHLPVVAGFLPRAITANLGVRRHVFDDVGGFAPDYDYGGPDTEFCWRLQLAGYRLAYAPDAVVHYRHRHTLRSVAVKAFRTGISRGRLYRDYGPRGMPRPRLAGVAVRWAGLVLAAPAAAVSPARRWRWVEQAAGAAGRVRGSWRFRVLYL